MRKVCGIEVLTLRADALTTFGGGGYADVLKVGSEEQLVCALDAFGAYGARVIGGGSNVVIADGKLAYPLISLEKMDAVEFFPPDVLVAQAGATVSKVMRTARRHGLGGLEFLAGVPARVGGALRMNAGAFGHEIGEFVISVCAAEVAKDGKWTFTTSDYSCFSYRCGAKGVVLGATFKLKSMREEESRRLSEMYLSKRRAIQPRLRSAGSAFKNGEDFKAGKLLDECGLKGVRIGGAAVSDMHANIIVNLGGARAEDYFSLVALAKKRAFEKFGVTLEREVEFFV